MKNEMNPHANDLNQSSCSSDQPPIPADIRVHPCSSVVSTDSETYERLARLSPGQYDRARQAEATRLGIRLETLDAEVARCRPDVSYDAQARAVKLQSVEP